jgi:RluA family pseudouridine synthase
MPNAAVPCVVLHRDDHVLALAKPAGVVTQPGKGHERDALLHGAFAVDGEALGSLGADRDWGLLHRLDRDVSGAVLLGRTPAAYDALRAAFADRRVTKRYLAIVGKAPPSPQGTCSRPIREEIRNHVKVATCPVRGGEPAETRWRTLASRGGMWLLDVEPVTGRLHQIRVHLAAMGCPVVGDRMYRADQPPNTSTLPPGRLGDPLHLHAWRVTFPHPSGSGPMTVEASAPEAMAGMLPGRGHDDPTDR